MKKVALPIVLALVAFAYGCDGGSGDAPAFPAAHVGGGSPTSSPSSSSDVDPTDTAAYDWVEDEPDYVELTDDQVTETDDAVIELDPSALPSP
jgi:hypothetical protein